MADLASVRRVRFSTSTRSGDPPRTPPTGPHNPAVARPRHHVTMSPRQAQDLMQERRIALTRSLPRKGMAWAQIKSEHVRPSLPAAQGRAAEIPCQRAGTVQRSSTNIAPVATVSAPAIQLNPDSASSARSESPRSHSRGGNGGSPRRSPRYGEGSPSRAVTAAASPPPLLPVRQLLFLLDPPASLAAAVSVAAGVPAVAVDPAIAGVFEQQQPVSVTTATATLAPTEVGAVAPVEDQGGAVSVLPVSRVLPATAASGRPSVPRRPRELAHLRMWAPETSWQPWREEEKEVPAAGAKRKRHAFSGAA